MIPLAAEHDFLCYLTNCNNWSASLTSLSCVVDRETATKIEVILRSKEILYKLNTTDNLDVLYFIVKKESLDLLKLTEKVNEFDVSLLVSNVVVSSVNRILDGDGNTALHHAFQSGDRKAVEFLISKSADMFFPNKNGITPAQLACVSTFLPDIVNIKNNENETPLYLLLSSDEPKKMEVFKSFIAAGGNLVGDVEVNIKGQYASTPLRVIWNERHIYAEFLDKAIAYGYSQQLIMLIFLTDILSLNSCIHKFEEHLESIDIDSLVPFLERVLNIYDLKFNEEGNCVFKAYSLFVCNALTSNLIRKVLATARQKDADGRKHIHRMVMQNRVDVIQIYIHLDNPKINCHNKFGVTPLDVAMENNKDEIVALLIHLERESFEGNHSLGVAINNKEWDKVSKLYFWGANFCLRNKNNENSLRLAVNKGAKLKLSELFNRPKRNGRTLFYEALTEVDLQKDLLRVGFCQELLEVSLANECLGLSLLLLFSEAKVHSLLYKMPSKHLIPIYSKSLINRRILRSVFIDHMVFCYAETNSSPLVVKNNTPASDYLLVQMHAYTLLVPIDSLLSIWLESQGEVEIMFDILRSYKIPIPNPRISYSLTLRRSLLQEKPEKILAVLGDMFRGEVAGKIKIIFEGEPGVDQGGLGREFIHLLLTHFIKAHRPKNSREAEELFYPVLEENLEGDFPRLPVSKRVSYEYLGALLMFCLNTTEYPSGQQFDLSFFEAIIKYPKEALHKDFRSIDFQDKKVFAQFLDVYRSIRELSESGRRMMSFIDDMLKEEQSTERLQEARKEIIETRFYPFFEIVHSILMGMRKAPFSWNYTLDDLRKQSASQLFNLLQGRLSHENVIAKLVFRSPNILTKTEKWLIEWITHATHEQLKSFVFALTGSEALGDSFTLTIIRSSQQANLIHTCSRTLELYEGHENEKDFNEALEFDLRESRKGFSAL